jgi:hypothetical protein
LRHLVEQRGLGRHQRARRGKACACSSLWRKPNFGERTERAHFLQHARRRRAVRIGDLGLLRVQGLDVGALVIVLAVEQLGQRADAFQQFFGPVLEQHFVRRRGSASGPDGGLP